MSEVNHVWMTCDYFRQQHAIRYLWVGLAMATTLALDTLLGSRLRDEPDVP